MKEMYLGQRCTFVVFFVSHVFLLYIYSAPVAMSEDKLTGVSFLRSMSWRINSFQWKNHFDLDFDLHFPLKFYALSC